MRKKEISYQMFWGFYLEFEWCGLLGFGVFFDSLEKENFDSLKMEILTV
jgi:hypothetical protein